MKKKEWKRFARVGSEVLSIDKSCSFNYLFDEDVYEIELIGIIKRFITPDIVEVQTIESSDAHFKFPIILHRKKIDSITLPLPEDESLNDFCTSSDPLYGICTGKTGYINFTLPNTDKTF
jgi:hypothetical protein